MMSDRDSEIVIIINYVRPNNSRNDNFNWKTSSKNAYIFPGSENKIEVESAQLVDWNCNFELSWFPFGTQRCTIKMTTQRKEIVTLLRNVAYTGKYIYLKKLQMRPKMCF